MFHFKSNTTSLYSTKVIVLKQTLVLNVPSKKKLCIIKKTSANLWTIESKP